MPTQVADLTTPRAQQHTSRPRIAHASHPHADPPQSLCGAPLGQHPRIGSHAEKCVVCLDLTQRHHNTR